MTGTLSRRLWPGGTPVVLTPLLRAALLVFVASAFLLPTEPAYALVFYVSLLLPALLPRGVSLWSTCRNSGAVLACLLIVWSAATLLWGHDDGHRSGHFAIGAASTLAFLLMTQQAWRHASSAWRPLCTVLIWAGAANAMLSIALGPFEPQHGDRLHGWGVTGHPILGASVMTVSYLAGLARILDERPGRAANAVACAVMAVFVVLTQSRGPLLSAAVATVFLCAAGPWRWRSLAVLAACGLLLFLLPVSIRHHQASMLVARGSSHRFEIWHRTLQMVAAHPIFGNGLAANLDLPGMTFPHDLYLSVLFYSGAVGLALFAALACAVTLRLWRVRRQGGAEWLWMVSLWINALLSGLTDLGQITKGPGPMWFIVWLPVSLILAWPVPPSETAPNAAGDDDAQVAAGSPFGAGLHRGRVPADGEDIIL